MVRRYEAEQSLAREEARDARKVQAAEDREEKLKQRMMSEIAAAREGGAQIGRERVAGQVLGQGGSNIAGDSPAMDPAEFANILKDNPEYEQVYRKAGLVKDAMDPRAQRATDEYDAALAAGASSATLQGLEKAKSNVLALIREERADKREDERARQFDIAEERRDKQFQASLGVRQQNADTAATRVQNAGVDRTASKDRLTTIINSANQTIRSLGDFPRRASKEEQDDWTRQRNDAVRLRDSATRELNGLFKDENKPSENPPRPGNSSDNKGSSNPGMPRPQSRAEVDKLPRGTRYIAPDGTVRTKS
jgi:hypothetical protein